MGLDRIYFFMVTAVLVLVGIFAIAVYLTAEIKKISLEKSVSVILGLLEKVFSLIWKMVNKNDKPVTSFVLYPNGLERVLNIVAKHSRLSLDNTVWESSDTEIRIQILPQNDSSIEAAMEEAKICIRNIAMAGNFDIDIEAYDMPFVEHSRLIVIYIASTEQQKAKIAAHRQEKAHMATLEAGDGLQPVKDAERQSWTVQLGYDAEYRIPIRCDISKTGHFCVIGGTGSGKSVAVLCFLYKLLSLDVPADLYIGDYKKSGDYAGISEHFAEAENVVGLIDEFYQVFESTPEGYSGLKVLLLDEYAGLMVWLTQQDKKRADEIRGRVANLLMLGRSRHCFVWCIQQRISATLFPAGIGAIDNFQICVGLGNLSPDSRRSLFAGEWPEDSPFMQSYKPSTGQGLILIDGKPIRPFMLPRIDDKGKLLAECRKKAARDCL